MSVMAKTPLPAQSHLWAKVQPGDYDDGYAVESDLTPRAAADLDLAMPGRAKALLALRHRNLAGL